QINRILRTSLLTKPTENTPQHIDLILHCIFLFPVEPLFPRKPLRPFHRNPPRRTSPRTKPASRTPLPPFLIPVEHMQTPEHRRERPLLLRIIHRRPLLKN